MAAPLRKGLLTEPRYGCTVKKRAPYGAAPLQYWIKRKKIVCNVQKHTIAYYLFSFWSMPNNQKVVCIARKYIFAYYQNCDFDWEMIAKGQRGYRKVVCNVRKRAVTYYLLGNSIIVACKR